MPDLSNLSRISSNIHQVETGELEYPASPDLTSALYTPDNEIMFL
jgi:hypothetical protein